MCAMELIEREFCYLYDGVFPKGVIAGFTKPEIEGRVPSRDTPKALSFLDGALDVSYMKQVHGARVHNVRLGGVYEGDGLVTEEKKLVLAVKTADCMPILLYDLKGGAAAVIHMGWRSAKEGILGNTGEDLSSFCAVAGPALRKCCYEVGKEFLDLAGLRPFVERKGECLFFDPVSFAKNELIKRGLPENSFFDSGICSYCSSSKLHSHRRSRGGKARTISFIVKTL